jgi:hypothetical protein
VLKFKIYIPFGGDMPFLNKAINSIIPQIEEHSSYEGKKIVVINNTMEDISTQIEHADKVDIWGLPFELTHAQEANWAIKDTLKTNQPFCLFTHTDAELLPGAIEAVIDAYEKVKDTKWYAVGVGSAVLVIHNPLFYMTENVWYDPFLFPMYYMDNHIGRIANLRGWSDWLYPHTPPMPHTGYTGEPLYIKHVGSHHLKNNPIFKAKNDVAFDNDGQTYIDIWGGLPGSETSFDPYAKNTLPRSVK